MPAQTHHYTAKSRYANRLAFVAWCVPKTEVTRSKGRSCTNKLVAKDVFVVWSGCTA